MLSARLGVELRFVLRLGLELGPGLVLELILDKLGDCACAPGGIASAIDNNATRNRLERIARSGGEVEKAKSKKRSRKATPAARTKIAGMEQL
jgi:hypothetical protein